RSASGITTRWFLAPPSACTRFPAALAVLWTHSATGVDPTKLTAATSGWWRSASTASRSPFTTLKTPSGQPASASRRATSRLGEGGGQREGRRGIAVGGLEEEGVPAGDGHRPHPHRDHDREVERGDAGHDAQRLTDGPGIHAAPHLLRELALEQLGNAAGEL